MKAFSITSTDLASFDSWSVDAVLHGVYELVDGIYKLKDEYVYTGLPTSVGTHTSITRKPGADNPPLSLNELCGLLVSKKISRTKFTKFINDYYVIKYRARF